MPDPGYPSTLRAGASSDHRNAAYAMLLPTMKQAIPIPWNAAEARLRGVYGFDSMDPRSRSFNLMRARLLGFRRQRNWRMFGILSASPTVGKSFIAANLAAAVSRDPRYQTYLVDVDLRRGRLAELFGIHSPYGLRDYLEQPPSAEPPPAFVLEGESLIIVPSIPLPVHSAELLASEQAQLLFRAMSNSDERNLFFFDLPPVFANDDAANTMEMLDAYIIVAEEGKTTQHEIEEAVDLLGEHRLAGVVLNKYRSGLVRDGLGVDSYYAAGYVKTASDEIKAND